MPSSLTRVLSRALGFSPHLPVSVFGTGTLTWLEAFLGSLESVTSVLRFPPHHTSEFHRTDLPILPPTCLDALFHSCASPILLRHPIAHSGFGWHWILNQLSIAYAFRPRLRSRLTLGGRAFPRKPQVYGGQDSHLPSRLLMPAFSLPNSPPLLPVRLLPVRNAPLPPGSVLTCQRYRVYFLWNFVAPLSLRNLLLRNPLTS